ncbi:MAG: glycoside hydrolase family 28 protein [Anaerolineae bacterium]|nr:glycoside hydrolase family 28 protein [Anaerolineae bacterium]
MHIMSLGEQPGGGWLPPFDVAQLHVPAFAPRTFDLRAYGGAGDGAALDTLAFARAIEACHRAGGGTVVVPAGTWLTGPIHLRSHVRLLLEKGALVRFSTRLADYPPVLTRWEGVECINYSPLIYARDCDNVAVVGEGTLDGQGEAWWHWKQRQGPAATALYHAQAAGVPVEDRVYATEEAALRPQFFQPFGCRGVLVEGVTFVNGPMWTIHPVYCSDVIVRGVTVRSEGPNTDGLNPDSCCNVLVEGCAFHTGDDCIAINSGMNEDGWRVGRPCENIIIRDCTMSEGHGAIAIGSGMSGGVRNVHVSNCHVTGGDQGIRLKSLRGRGGLVERVLVEKIEMSNLRREAIVLSMFYESSTAVSSSDAPPTFRNIRVRDVVCTGAGTAISIRGLPERPIELVSLENLCLHAVEGIRCQDVVDLALRDVTGAVRQEPEFYCSNVRCLNVSNLTVERKTH